MFESITTSIMLLAQCLLMFTLAVVGRMLARQLFHVPILVDLIFFFVMVKIGLYYFFPAVMNVFSDYKYVREDYVPLANLVYIYTIEIVSWFFWLIGLLSIFLMFRLHRREWGSEYLIANNYYISRTMMLIISVGYIYFMANGAIFGLADAYESVRYIEPFKVLLFSAGVAIGPVLLVISLRYYGFMYFMLGMVSFIVGIMGMSARGALVYSLLYVLFLAHYVMKSKKTIFIIMGVIAAFGLIYFMYGGLFASKIHMDETGQLSMDINVDTKKSEGRSTLEEIEWRFGASTRIGTAFITLYDRGEGAGINPIMHSLMGLLPRSINPEKPIPSTKKGDDIYSQGMYLISKEITKARTNMVEFPTGGHFYWEFGFPGVVVLSVISGLYIGLCAHFFSKLGLIAIPLMVSVFKPWGYVDPKIWVSDIVLQIYQIIMPLIVLVFFVRFGHGLFIWVRRFIVRYASMKPGSFPI